MSSPPCWAHVIEGSRGTCCLHHAQWDWITHQHMDAHVQTQVLHRVEVARAAAVWSRSRTQALWLEHAHEQQVMHHLPMRTWQVGQDSREGSGFGHMPKPDLQGHYSDRLYVKTC